MNEVELVLDRKLIECPALVMETFLSIGMHEISDDSTTLADDYCWMVSKQSIFAWSAATKGSVVQLPLPPSGLPYSAKSVVVYKKDRTTSPGVLVVSGEGVARHFPSLTSSVHEETIIDLASEVTLSVQFFECSTNESSFILTTTSGSVYSLKTSSVSFCGGIEWLKIGSRETLGIRRRLSNILFGSQTPSHDSSRVVNSLIYRGYIDDSEGPQPVVLTVSPSTINVFGLLNRTFSKTLNISLDVERRVTQYFQRSSRGRSVAGTNIWFLDAAKFRNGVLLLLAGSHDDSEDVTFFLAMIRPEISATAVYWFSGIPAGAGYTGYYEAAKESLFIGHVFLCVPVQTANLPSCECTDGVIIVYPNFVQSVFLPDNLKGSNDLLLNKIVPIPLGTKLVGHACDERFCYIMTFDGAISCVRLLPKGFDDDLTDDGAFMDELCSFKESVSQNRLLDLFVSAFILFSAKNIVEACEVMKPLLKRPDAELATLVYSFLKHVLDLPVGPQPEKGLIRKRTICNKTILFLKHTNIYNRVATTKILMSTSSNLRTGASILNEMTERAVVAIALWQYESVREDRTEVMERVIMRLNSICSVSSYESSIYSTLTMLHHLPTACVETIRDISQRAVDKEAKQQFVDLCAEVLLTFVNAIETYRRNAPIKRPGDLQWTTGTVSDAICAACKVLLKEMHAMDVPQVYRLHLKDYVVRLAKFHLSECSEPINGHEVIVALYDLGECDVADFKVLIKVCLELDDVERRARLDEYKRRYFVDEFDMYLCKYLKQKKMNHMLLEEKGDRADRYLLSCEDIRWRRELQNNQYEQASHSLLSLADRETSNAYRQRNLYAFAKLSALCNEKASNDVTEESSKKLVLLKHQSLIPESLIKTVYPDNPKQPLTIAEMIELNMLDADTLEGHKRALYLLARLLRNEDGDELQSLLTDVWVSLVKHSHWNQVKNILDFGDTPFGGVLRKMIEDDTADDLLPILPSCDVLLEACRMTLSGNEMAPKWIRSAAERASSVMNTNLHTKKEEQLKRSKAILSILQTSNVFGSRPPHMAKLRTAGTTS